MRPIRYLAIGDSYTIGTGLEDESASFPSVIARRITNELGVPVAVQNLGVEGYTTGDVIRDELPVLADVRPEFVTVLIGANDIVQQVDENGYRSRLHEIYDAIRQFGPSPDRTIALAIPDFSALPGATSFGPPNVLHERVQSFNRIGRSEAEQFGFDFIDVTALNPTVAMRVGWLASDQLHPGPSQYEAIAALIWERSQARWRRLQFERWSAAGKAVLAEAGRSARSGPHSYIGTEHVLLGLYADSSAEAFLRRRGLTRQKVHRTLERVLGRDTHRERPDRVIPTTRVKRMLLLATQEAVTANAELVEAQHVLKALVLEGEGIAAQMLADFADIDRSNVDDVLHAWRDDSRPLLGRTHTGLLQAPGLWVEAVGRWLQKR